MGHLPELRELIDGAALYGTDLYPFVPYKKSMRIVVLRMQVGQIHQAAVQLRKIQSPLSQHRLDRHPPFYGRHR